MIHNAGYFKQGEKNYQLSIYTKYADYIDNLRGFYKFFFNLVVMAFGEELLFRGFVYNRLKIKSVAMAIILSGMYAILDYSI